MADISHDDSSFQAARGDSDVASDDSFASVQSASHDSGDDLASAPSALLRAQHAEHQAGDELGTAARVSEPQGVSAQMHSDADGERGADDALPVTEQVSTDGATDEDRPEQSHSPNSDEAAPLDPEVVQAWRAFSLIVARCHVSAWHMCSSARALWRSLQGDRHSSDVQRLLQARLKEAQAYKEAGNVHFHAQQWDEALAEFAKALSAAPPGIQECAVYHANSAACYLHLEQYEECVASCSEALLVDATYQKALMRRMIASEALDELENALRDARKVC